MKAIFKILSPFSVLLGFTSAQKLGQSLISEVEIEANIHPGWVGHLSYSSWGPSGIFTWVQEGLIQQEAGCHCQLL